MDIQCPCSPCGAAYVFIIGRRRDALLGCAFYGAKVYEERIAKTRSPFTAQHIAEVAKDHATGAFSGTNDLVKRITGKEPIGLREFVEKNKRLFDSCVAKRRRC